MACCAFAIFLVGQLYGVVAVLRRFGLVTKSTDQRGEVAAAWHPGITPAPAPRPTSRRRVFSTTVAMMALLLISAFAGFHAAHVFHKSFSTSGICTTRSQATGYTEGSLRADD